MSGENYEKNSKLLRMQCMEKVSFSNMLFLLLCSDFDSGLELGLELFVFSSCCNL